MDLILLMMLPLRVLLALLEASMAISNQWPCVEQKNRHL